TTLCPNTGLRCPSGTTCTADGEACTNNDCGNGIVEIGEACDDGNLRDSDGCSRDCQYDTLACGNGNFEVGEICDDGNEVSGDGCSADCQSDETCGNGVRDTIKGETCDDGNTAPDDGCSPDCKL